MKRRYTYFVWDKSGLFKKDILFICEANDILEADKKAEAAGVNYMKCLCSVPFVNSNPK